MLYIKNVSTPSRIARVVIGGAIAVVAVVKIGSVAGALLAISAGVMALTGVLGYCPMCSSVGKPHKGKHDAAH